jgi:hypothetical protein
VDHRGRPDAFVHRDQGREGRVMPLWWWVVAGLAVVLVLMFLLVGAHHEVAYWWRERKRRGMVDLTGEKR